MNALSPPSRVVRTAAPLLALLMAFGCSTVVRPFVHLKPDYSELPADALREVALEIEKAVQAGDRDAQIADRAGLVLGDDAIRQGIRTRAARAELLNEFLDTGHVYEGNRGLVVILRTKAYKEATTRRQRDRNALLVMGENSNRWAIYEGLIKASALSPKSLSAIQDAFHQARVQCMKTGQKYEDATGAVVVKR